MEKLDKEIETELGKCYKFYEGVMPFCQKIQQHIQFVARGIFQGIILQQSNKK